MSCSSLASQPALSTQYLRAKVTRWVGAIVPPSTFGVEFAFTSNESIPPSVWHVGDWEVVGGSTYARVLVGPEADVELAPGHYIVWIRIEAVPEQIVRNLGSLEIT